MIIDNLENFAGYAPIMPEVWDIIAEFLRSLSPETTGGRYTIDGDRVYAIVNPVETHPLDLDKLEYHRKYADIQVVISGGESIVCGEINDNVTSPYDESRDIGFCRMAAATVTAELVPGMFMLIFPGEGHAPDVGDGSKVFKAVVKVAAECFCR